MKRGILLIIGAVALAIGVAGGLLYTWVLDPVEYYDTAPDSLHVEDKLFYLALIGDLYVYEQDLELAQARLSALEVEADGSTVAGLLEQYLDHGGRPEDVRNLAQLARDLGASGGVLLVFGAPPSPSPESTSSPEPLFQVTTDPGASPTPAPSATPVPSYQVVEQTALCADSGKPGKITVWVEDQAGNELSGVEVVVSWATGQDRFFTGLWPEKGIGYADFMMKPQTEYEVDLANYRGDAVQGLTPDLSAGICPTETIAVDWRLIFQVTASDSP